MPTLPDEMKQSELIQQIVLDRHTEVWITPQLDAAVFAAIPEEDLKSDEPWI